MEKRILFISEKKSMIANALIEGLKSGAFEVEQVKANVTDISRAAGDGSDMPDIWILFMQGVEVRLREVLSYVRDQVEEHNVRFFVIGTADEIEENLKGFPPADLRGSFSRPFRTDEIVDRMTVESMNVQRLSESKRILVVDDDATMLRTMKDMLSGRYRVYTANSGMNAIQMLVSTEVDLVLLDYEMPVVKGPQILEMIRSETHTKDLPVMFLTSKNDRESIIEVMSLNPVNYLLKSLPQAEILSKIEEYFAQEARR
ncbi:MAG: response regulator [Lachnospiraceae bacterium]|nr:response regulator [Lachnospiraceae bacterium]